MGMKAPDDQTVPLCNTCHNAEFHQHGTLPGMTLDETVALFWRVRKRLQADWAQLQERETS
jgi:hypothetical protein